MILYFKYFKFILKRNNSSNEKEKRLTKIEQIERIIIMVNIQLRIGRKVKKKVQLRIKPKDQLKDVKNCWYKEELDSLG